MADRIQNIKVRYVVDTTGLSKAEASLNNLSKEEKEVVMNARRMDAEASKASKNISTNTDNASKSMGGLSSSIKNVGGAIIAAFSIGAIINLGKQIIDITARFQKFEAVLTNTLGSSSAAQKALQMIQDFAASTPFSVEELTESFVKLANQGFKPTQAELQKLGDLASAMGKSFDQLTEAIIDAQTGEFERLKEFGIRAQKEGDKVTFTFKGIKTQTDFTADSIRAYILSLGDLQGVSGGMAAISKTLGGQISNLGDSFDNLLVSIGKNASGGVSEAINFLSSVIGEITKAVQGQSSVFDTWIEIFSRIGSIIGKTFSVVQKLFELFGLADKKTSALRFAFEGLATVIKIALVPLEAFIQTINLLWSVATLNMEEIKKQFQELVDIITLSSDKAGTAVSTINDVIAKLQKKAQEEQAAIVQKGEEKTTKITKDEIEKRLKLKMDALKQEEELVLRGLKVGDATKDYLIKKEIEFNQRRLDLLKSFGKQETYEYQSLILRKAELEKELRLELESQNKQQIINFRKARNDERAEEIPAEVEHQKQLVDIYKQANKEKDKSDQERANNQKAIQQKSFELASTIANGIYELETANNQAALADLQKSKDQQLQLVGDNAQARNNIEASFAAKERAIKQRQANADRQKAIFDIVSTSIVNTVKALGTPPVPNFPLAALTGAIGAAQLAFLLARPIPKFNKGTKSVPGVDTGKDSVLAWLRPGESVIPVDKTKKYSSLISDIIDGRVGKMNYPFMSDMISGKSGGSEQKGVMKELKGLRKDIKSLPVSNVQIDKKGIRTFVRQQNSETEFINNYFRS